MILTVLFQALVQYTAALTVLLPLTVIFTIVSLLSHGNAVVDPKGIFITGAR